MGNRKLSTAARAYIFAVCAAGTAAIGAAALELYYRPVGWRWLVLAVLTLISGSATVRLPSVPATISISETFVFTAVLLFGPAAGTLTVALDALVISIWLAWRGHPLYRLAFNVAALPASLWIGAHVYYWFGNVPPLYLSTEVVEITRLIAPLISFTVVYFLLNSWLVAVAISLEKGESPVNIWRQNFAWLSLNYFGGASIAALLITYTRNIDLAYLAFGLPLLAIIYFTFSTSLGRVADANRHLKELNTLYLSTIETLAMAIDAKDQITHGHIRRVQSFAIRLAAEIGIKDQAQISAIEAASLLHDMGKLAVPEYILNKPGPLTAAEFEKMKLHASAGADILSSIDFPYPVVPIVRHHHENWDGTGYPDRLKGSEIPIGARVLSVVDCFDALTSDRPYRPRLSDTQAIRILVDRRGTMYDPLIVDTFIRLHAKLVSTQMSGTTSSSPALAAIIGGANSPHPTHGTGLEDIAASTEESLVLYELTRDLAAREHLGDIMPVLCRHLRRLMPATTSVVYRYNPDTDELVMAGADGEHSPYLAGLRIPRGQRLSGWVAANKQTIVNSDPALDLGDTARTLVPRLRSCLSAPLVTENGVVGVITLYSTQQLAFLEDHARIVSSVAEQIAKAVERAAGRDSDHTRAATHEQSQTFSTVERVFLSLLTSSPVSLLFVEIDRAAESGHRQHSATAERTVAFVRECVKETLRSSDSLFDCGPGQFVALLPHVGAEDAAALARRLRHIAESGETQRPASSKTRVGVGAATSPADGKDFHTVLQCAQGRAMSDRSSERPPSVH